MYGKKYLYYHSIEKKLFKCLFKKNEINIFIRRKTLNTYSCSQSLAIRICIRQKSHLLYVHISSVRLLVIFQIVHFQGQQTE